MEVKRRIACRGAHKHNSELTTKLYIRRALAPLFAMRYKASMFAFVTICRYSSHKRSLNEEAFILQERRFLLHRIYAAD